MPDTDVKVDIELGRITINEPVTVGDLFARLTDVFTRPELAGLAKPMERDLGAYEAVYYLMGPWIWAGTEKITDHTVAHRLSPAHRIEGGT